MISWLTVVKSNGDVMLFFVGTVSSAWCIDDIMTTSISILSFIQEDMASLLKNEQWMFVHGGVVVNRLVLR